MNTMGAIWAARGTAHFLGLAAWTAIVFSPVLCPAVFAETPAAASGEEAVTPEQEVDAAPAEAEEPLSWLEWAADQAAMLRGRSTAAEKAAAARASEEKAAELAVIREELDGIRQDMRQLQETLDFLIGRIMTDLEDENEQLRWELRRLYMRTDPAAMGEGARVPRPGGGLLESIWEDARMEYLPEEDLRLGFDDSAAPQPPAPEAVAFTYTVYQEWGRSPEEAANLGPGASSLKGMVCVTPEGSRREDLEQMARELRAQFGAYDNLNIEVFDDVEAARAYAEDGMNTPDHRVASISRHKASGRDSALVFHGGATYEVMP